MNDHKTISDVLKEIKVKIVEDKPQDVKTGVTKPGAFITIDYGLFSFLAHSVLDRIEEQLDAFLADHSHYLDDQPNLENPPNSLEPWQKYYRIAKQIVNIMHEQQGKILSDDSPYSLTQWCQLRDKAKTLKDDLDRLLQIMIYEIENS